MPLERQLVPVSLGGGLDTKSDPKQVAMGSFLALSNTVFGETGAIKKRPGYSRPAALPSGMAVAMSAFEDELLVFDGGQAWSRAEANDTWSARGRVDSCIVGGRQVIRTSAAQQLNPDVATAPNGVQVYAWEDSRGGVRCAVLDSATGAYYQADALVDAGGQQPKCLFWNGLLAVLYSDGTATLKVVTIDPSNPGTASSPTSLLTDGHASYAYDACTHPANTQLYIVYLAAAASGTIKVLSFASPSTLTASASVDAGTNALDGGPSVVSIAPSLSSTPRVALVWATGGSSGGGTSGLRGAVYPAALGAATLASTVFSSLTSTTNVLAVTLCNTPTATQWSVLWSLQNGGADTTLTMFGSLSTTAAAASGVFMRGVGLASKAWPETVGGNAYRCVLLARQSPLQSTYFAARVDASNVPEIFAKCLPDVGGGLRTNRMLSEVALSPSLGVGLVSIAASNAGKAITEANTIFSLLGVAEVTLDFAHSNRFLSATQSRCLLTVGGYVQSYDGVSFVEQGFHLDPEGVTAVAAGTNGHLGAGVYQYVVCYEWTDNRGQVQRSGGSVPLSITTTATNHVALTIPTLRLTKKSSQAPIPRGDISIAIYRTDVNGILFHRCSSTVAPLLNSVLVDSVTFVDLAADSDIDADELLYTTGGVLDDTAPPACSLIAPFQGRIVLSGLEDPNLIWYSKNRFDNTNYNTIPVEFSAELTIGVDARGGDITALGAMDDKLIVFKESAIFVLSGDGPNDTGGGDTFADPTLVTGDVGCSTPNSVVTMPNGIMFQSSKGIYLLDRSMNVAYIGAPVEAFNGEQVLSATLHPTANQVIFTLVASPNALVFDYVVGQWTTWSGHACVDSDIYRGVFAFVTSAGQLNEQTPGAYADGTDPINISIRTSHISLAGLSGFQRCYRAFVLGSCESDTAVTVEIAYDFSDTPDSGVMFALLASDTLTQYRIDCRVQRCTAVSLAISENQTVPGEGFVFSSLSLEIGALPYGNRLPQTQTHGAS